MCENDKADRLPPSISWEEIVRRIDENWGKYYAEEYPEECLPEPLNDGPEEDDVHPPVTLGRCPECRDEFKPRTAGHRFCSRECQRKNARGLRLRHGARDLESTLRDLVRLLRAGEPIPETRMAVARLRAALDDYETATASCGVQLAIVAD